MSAVAPISLPGRPGKRRLAPALIFFGLVLAMMIPEQRQIADAFVAIRDDTPPLVERLWAWAGDLSSGEADTIAALRDAWVGDAAPPLRAEATDRVLVGEFRALDPQTASTTGGVAFIGALIQFERAGLVRTRPFRIAAGRDAFAFQQTFADHLDAASDAQVELRQVVAARPGQTVAASPLCNGDIPAVVGLLHRGRQVQMMLFRQGAAPGSQAPATVLCGTWTYRAR